MDYKMPFYMAFPDLDYVDEERMSKRDVEYMRSIYPSMARKLWPYIEQECDRLEYEGSLIYDAYPDKLMLRLMCSRIYEVARVELSHNGDMIRHEEAHWVREMIEILVYQELCKRRESWRKHRRRWY